MDAVTVLNLPRDKIGVQRPQGATAIRSTAPVTPLTASPRVASQPSPAPCIAAAFAEERRRGERRQGWRRRQRLRRAVLLDTRSHYERRTQERRHQATDLGTRYPPLGVDIYI